MTDYRNTKPSEWVIRVSSEGFPGLIGPFHTAKAAANWGLKNISNGVWNTSPVYSPFYEYGDGSK